MQCRSEGPAKPGTHLKSFHYGHYSTFNQSYKAPTAPFTAVPNWNFWNKGRKSLSSWSKSYEIWSKWIRSGGIQKNSKYKTPSADSNLGPQCEVSEETNVLPKLGPRVEASGKTIVLPRLGPRVEASGKTIALPKLGPRVEARNEIRNPPCGGRGKWVAGILRL
ncbi:hypothetical protein AVEN_253917-1 [Araneus ventricosus]|uniref:Uncharacterized protein n=1 Tax=Araneus ventricosus TaxID=182803 RepID=A0A4Y2EN21_ARAVE|nr:hypothetical protein AVEN_253917-1 [Araneus ventricosus]